MPGTRLDGGLVAKEIQAELEKEVVSLKERGVHPCLAVLQVGDRTDSSTYIRMKRAAAEQIGRAHV